MRMKHLLKLILAGLGVVLALAVVAVIALTLLVDPNDYRDEIGDQVRKHTGRELKIDGEITLSYFPWLGLKLGAMELGNAKGFGPEPFASIEAADARVKLLPLFTARVEMDTVVLHGLQLSLKRRRDGVTNWDDLAGKSADAPVETEAEKAPSAPPEQALAALAIGGIEVRDANVQWLDETADQHISITGFNLISGAISFDEAFPLAINGKFESDKPSLNADIDLTTAIGLNLSRQQYRMDGLKLTIAAAGDVVPGGRADLALLVDLAADLEKQTASATGLTLKGMGMTLNVSVQGEQIIDKPSFKGELTLGEFVPRQLLSDLGIDLPEMADPSAMTKAGLYSRFDAGLDHVTLQGLKLRLDKTSLTGDASVRRFAKPVIRYQLALDEIDVDRYLPPPSEPSGQKEAAGTQPSEVSAGLPLELLRSLDIDGTFKIGKVKVMNLHSDTIVATVRAQKGQFRVNPLSARLYQGGYSGDLRLDARGDTPIIGMDEKLTGVQSGPLLKDFLGKEYASGTANLAAKMTARGIEPMAIRKSLNGNGSFSFEDGKVKGVNIGYLIRKAYALYKKQPVPPEEVQETDFADLKGSFTVKDGLVETNDLLARSPLFQVDGKGTAHLVSEKIDMRLDTKVISDLKSAGKENIDELKGVTVPITVKGSFSDPKFGIDIASVLRAKAEAAVEKKKEEVKAVVEKKKEEAQEKAKERVEEEKQKLQKGLEDKLKDTFKDRLKF